MSEQRIVFPVAGENKIAVPHEGEALSEAEKIKKGICPCCSGTLVFQEGCKACYGCGWGGCE